VNFTLVSHRKEKDKTVLKVRTHPDALSRLFGAKSEEVEFIGDCTVWHRLPSWKRPGTTIEGILANFHARIQHEAK
jgi:hypothetical protein